MYYIIYIAYKEFHRVKLLEETGEAHKCYKYCILMLLLWLRIVH